MSEKYRVCVVCTGNICRSPMGEVILRAKLEQAGLADAAEVDSAGTHGWHEGGPADPRTVSTLQAAGYDGSAHRARQFDAAWFAERDLVVVADHGHAEALRRLAPDDSAAAKVRLLREFDPAAVAAGTLDVDDPYYGDQAGFERCLAEVSAACDGIVEHVRENTAR